MKPKKILYIHFGIQVNDILWGLIEMGEEVEMYPGELELLEYSEERKNQLSDYLKKHPTEFVISVNFIQNVADACQENGVLYASWTFDSPLLDLYLDSALHDCNRFFLFDKKQVQRMKEAGLSHVYHLPLAANVARMSLLEFGEEDVERFRSEISFVGDLYCKNRYNQERGNYSEEVKDILDRHIIGSALKWSKGSSLFPSFTKEEAEKFAPYASLANNTRIDPVYYNEIEYLSKKISEIDRICCLNALALSHQVDLYTASDTSALENVKVHGKVSYNEELPKIYFLSKINLNFTLRSIETGVPQRIFDIMGAGGFVMSNYQEELEEMFVPDQEIVLFHSPEELAEKADYYLRHDEKRQQIVLAAFQKVCEEHTYPLRLAQLLKVMRGS